MRRRLARNIALLALVLATTWLVAGAPVHVIHAARAGAPAGQDGLHRAALVVRFADGSVQDRCVSFDEPTISGAELLLRSGLQVIMDYNSGYGGAVCSINGSGCAFPSQNCFCQCQGAQCEYWAYYHWTDGGWQYSQVGASAYQVADGALEGWSWGPGNFSSGTEPPQVTFADICGSAAEPSTTPVPSPTPVPTTVPTPGSAGLPQVTFRADSVVLNVGTCTVLQWVTWDAVQVTLNGAPVIAQDRLEVCPVATQRYTLVATNDAGQAARDLVVAVNGGVPEATTAPTPAQTISSANSAPAVDLMPAQVPGPAADLAGSEPPPAQQGSPLVAVVHAQDVSLPTPLQPEIVLEHPVAGIPAPALTLAPLPTPTPRPRRMLGADGRPTPTPILLAQAGTDMASPQLSPDAGQREPAAPVEDRSFRASLLPGYAAYLMVAATLIAAGVWVVQRRAVVDPGRPGLRRNA